MTDADIQLKILFPTEQHIRLVTSVAGFIGSNLLETLLKLNQRLVGLNIFVPGHQPNLDVVQPFVTPAQWQNFNFIQGRGWSDSR